MNDLIKSVSIENLLQKRAAILERFTKMQELAQEIKDLEKMFGDTYPPRCEWEFDGKRHSFINYYSSERDTKTESLRDYTKAIDRLAWKMLMQESGNLALMDAKAKDEWNQSLKEDKHPELTYENIQATFSDLHASRGEMFDRGVTNVFKSLSWHYKTNSPFKLGKRIVVTGMHGYYSTNGGAKLDDLVRCFRVLEGKPEIAEYKQTIQAQVASMRHNSGSESFIENEYFTLKVFKNNNGHVTFKRLDLVTKLNEIIARTFPFHIPQDNKQAA